MRAEAGPTLLPAEFLLSQLNEALTRTALLLQPVKVAGGVRNSPAPSPQLFQAALRGDLLTGITHAPLSYSSVPT